MNKKTVTLQIDHEDRLWFLNYVQAQCDQARTHLKASSWPELGQLFHGIKGSGSSFGYMEVTEIGRVGEEASGTGNRDKVVDCVTQLDTFAKQSLKELNPS